MQLERFILPCIFVAASACIASNAGESTDRARSRAAGNEGNGPGAAPTAACVKATRISRRSSGHIVSTWAINERGDVLGEDDAGSFIWTGGRFVSLETIEGSPAAVIALNDRGESVGFAAVGSSTRAKRAFLWKDDGSVQELGTLGGDETIAYDINDSGQVIGTSRISTGEHHVFLWQNGVMTDLGPSSGTGRMHINDAGQIVFEGHVSGDPDWHIVLWKSGSMTDLGHGAFPNLNARGDVTFHRSLEAFFWRNGDLTEVVPFEGGHTSNELVDLNDLGQVLGDSCCTFSYLWEAGVVTQILSADPAEKRVRVSQMNDHGQVVGYLDDVETPRAFSWKDGKTTVLNDDAAGEVSYGRDVNDRGQIVGVASHRIIDGTNPIAGMLWEIVPCEEAPPRDAGTDATVPPEPGNDAGRPDGGGQSGGGKTW